MTRTPGWHPEETASQLPLHSRAGLLHQRHSFSTPRCRGVGTLCVAGPQATSLRGLWVSGFLPPCNGGLCGRAATLEPTRRRRGRLEPRAGNPKRQRPNCHLRPKGTLEPAWVLRQGVGPQRPPVRRGGAPRILASAALVPHLCRVPALFLRSTTTSNTQPMS